MKKSTEEPYSLRYIMCGMLKVFVGYLKIKTQNVFLLKIKLAIVVIYFSDSKTFQQEKLVALGDLISFQPYQSGNIFNVIFY